MATLGAHLVGSIPLASTTAVLTQLPSLLPSRLRRLPDGETTTRSNFTAWQAGVFAAVAPETIDPKWAPHNAAHTPTPETINAAVSKLSAAGLETGYDRVALESYAEFKKLREEAKIPARTKFQVCLPGLISVTGLLHPAYAPAREPLYEAALLRSLDAIQAGIPAADLALQLDAAIEIDAIERAGPWTHHLTAETAFDDVVERLSRFAKHVRPDVELGLHVCYGDMGHVHFVEPQDLAT